VDGPVVPLQALAEGLLRSLGTDVYRLKTTPYPRYVLELRINPSLMAICNYDDYVRDWTTASEFILPYDTLRQTPISNVLTVGDLLDAHKAIEILSAIHAAMLRATMGAYEQAAVNSILPVFEREQLLEMLRWAAPKLSTATLEATIDVLCWSGEDAFLDLQYRPIVRTGNAYLLLPRVAAHSALARNALTSERQRIPDAGPMFARIVAQELGSTFPRVARERPLRTAGRDVGDVDVAILLDRRLYLFECKYSLLGANTHEFSDTFDDVQRGSGQLHTAMAFMSNVSDLSSLLRSWFPGASDAELIVEHVRPCILTSTRVLSGMICDGIPVRDRFSLRKFVASGEIEVTGLIDGAVRGLRAKLWQGDSCRGADLDDYLSPSGRLATRGCADADGPSTARSRSSHPSIIKIRVASRRGSIVTVQRFIGPAPGGLGHGLRGGGERRAARAHDTWIGGVARRGIRYDLPIRSCRNRRHPTASPRLASASPRVRLAKPVLPIAVVLLTLDRRRFQPPCRAPDPLAPPALARLAAVAALAESVACGARVERLTAGSAHRKAKRLLDSFMLVHASVPRTRGAHGLTPRPRSGTVRGVQSRVRVWAEGPGLPPRAFTLCASISSRLLRQDVRRHERSSLPIRPAREGTNLSVMLNERSASYAPTRPESGGSSRRSTIVHCSNPSRSIMVQSQWCRSPVRMPPSHRATSESIRSSRSIPAQPMKRSNSSSVRIERSFLISCVRGQRTAVTGLRSIWSSSSAERKSRCMTPRTLTIVSAR
jgi:hypothetical protein